MRSKDMRNMDDGYSLERTKIILKWIGRQKRILDLGCYDGRDSELILKQGNEVYGIERMTDAAKTAQTRGIIISNIDLEKDDWSFPKKFFDVVLAGEIIEHTLDTDLFLKNIYKYLKDDGFLILTTPNLASFGRRLLLLIGKNPFIEVSNRLEVNTFLPVGHVRYFVKDSLYKLLRYHGFEIVELTADDFNLGLFHSKILAKFFPTLSWRFILKARKKRK